MQKILHPSIGKALAPLMFLLGCQLVTACAGGGTEPAGEQAPPASNPPPGSGTTGPTTGGGAATEPAPFTDITNAHNQVRSAVSPAASPPLGVMMWVPSIAAAAQQVADQCKFEHSPNGFGENLYASAGSMRSAQEVVTAWGSEKADYHYASNSCAANKVCGHYTQIVWRSSTQLGCGYRQCTTNSPFQGFPTWDLWVCNYNPPGNFVGKRPY